MSLWLKISLRWWGPSSTKRRPNATEHFMKVCWRREHHHHCDRLALLSLANAKGYKYLLSRDCRDIVRVEAKILNLKRQAFSEDRRGSRSYNGGFFTSSGPLEM